MQRKRKVVMVLLVIGIIMGILLSSGCLSRDVGKETCTVCGGSGKCSWCDGSGWTIWQLQECSHCGGTGKCSNCDGTGKV